VSRRPALSRCCNSLSNSDYREQLRSFALGFAPHPRERPKRSRLAATAVPERRALAAPHRLHGQSRATFGATRAAPDLTRHGPAPSDIRTLRVRARGATARVGRALPKESHEHHRAAATQPAQTTRAERPRQPGGERHGSYTDDSGRRREIVTVAGAAGTVLVIDRLTGSLGDARLVSHLATDEPAENAGILSAMYLAEECRSGCRPMIATDLGDEFGEGVSPPDTPAVDTLDVHEGASFTGNLRDARGRTYVLTNLQTDTSIPELRWCRHVSTHETEQPEVLRLREVIGALESFEPMRTLTSAALRRYEQDPGVSIVMLRAEFERVCASPILLNRGLREAVQTNRPATRGRKAPRHAVDSQRRAGAHRPRGAWDQPERGGAVIAGSSPAYAVRADHPRYRLRLPVPIIGIAVPARPHIDREDE
jgi:hypothetical protein